MSGIGERLITGENGRSFSIQEVWISSEWKLFGDVISFGSYSNQHRAVMAWGLGNSP